jgi:hypothetical protein
MANLGMMNIIDGLLIFYQKKKEMCEMIYQKKKCVYS